MTALKFAAPTGVGGWLVRHGVNLLLIGSALRWVVVPRVSLFNRAIRGSPTRFSPTTMASADFSPPFGDEISPGNDTLLHCTAAAFTSASTPVAFAVLCQLDALRRPSMRFLFIGSQFSPSLPSPLRSPSGAWLQMVVSSFSCSVFLQET